MTKVLTRYVVLVFIPTSRGACLCFRFAPLVGVMILYYE